MRLEINGDLVVTYDKQGRRSELNIGSPEAFHVLSQLWLRSGWDNKYVYGFSWMGRPIIQLPEDILRIQELIYSVKPDVLIETGIAHGGSLIFYASLFCAMDKGRAIGVDVEIRPHNRRAIETHEMRRLITMIEGSSVHAKVVNEVGANIKPGERGLVILDSDHTRQHVLAELHAYSQFVAVGSYIVACDGIMQDLVGAPRTSSSGLRIIPNRPLRISWPSARILFSRNRYSFQRRKDFRASFLLAQCLPSTRQVKRCCAKTGILIRNEFLHRQDE